ncbi:hypothetical protein [Legionella jordanis]|uniref:Uncharacterized protein n=1 Tax=Legionella jordanis TaxID=456 RepID=A0A0W0VCZ3_9GAMM|nr:hypothetical protein [Legionella jordanis]KTD17991.1 hypothetical protein Ljor_2297 [Legionella jordanis]RMX02319.1 hypothetical protein EAW55_08655 [Legionella jordanis]RMX21196.1 hypothetical protein EAS68_03215 [Legionella jordanis]VEH13917.1 Uncharacterised protein [Legionella jordanis]HAT8714297.1 hypothetical protein [Legionella jordanis]
MYDEMDAIKEDFHNVLQRNGYSPNQFEINIKRGSEYNPYQIVTIQIIITVSKNAIEKQYHLYPGWHSSSNWPADFESDLQQGVFDAS